MEQWSNRQTTLHRIWRIIWDISCLAGHDQIYPNLGLKGVCDKHYVARQIYLYSACMIGNHRKLLALNEQGVIVSEAMNANFKAPSPH